jgi:hypothetical protein
MSRPRAHEDTCVVYCTGNEPEGTSIHPWHRCWCKDGGLSYDEFKAAHPEWALLDSWDWLRVAQGKQWLRDMDPAR